MNWYGIMASKCYTRSISFVTMRYIGHLWKKLNPWVVGSSDKAEGIVCFNDVEKKVWMYEKSVMMVKMISIEAQEKNMKGGVPNCLGEIRISLIPQIYIYI